MAYALTRAVRSISRALPAAGLHTTTAVVPSAGTVIRVAAAASAGIGTGAAVGTAVWVKETRTTSKAHVAAIVTAARDDFAGARSPLSAEDAACVLTHVDAAADAGVLHEYATEATIAAAGCVPVLQHLAKRSCLVPLLAVKLAKERGDKDAAVWLHRQSYMTRDELAITAVRFGWIDVVDALQVRVDGGKVTRVVPVTREAVA